MHKSFHLKETSRRGKTTKAGVGGDNNKIITTCHPAKNKTKKGLANDSSYLLNPASKSKEVRATAWTSPQTTPFPEQVSSSCSLQSHFWNCLRQSQECQVQNLLSWHSGQAHCRYSQSVSLSSEGQGCICPLKRQF